MKKQIKMIGFAALAAFLTVANASAATTLVPDQEGLCGLIEQFIGIFELLRTLAFVGAGFVIAGWAWGYISKPAEIKIVDEVQKKGLSMLVGFILLFGIGAFLSVITSAAGLEGMGCAVLETGW